MSDIGLDWFSKTGTVSIEVVQKKLISHDSGINEMLKIGVDVGFRKLISDATTSVENRVSAMCQKAMGELHGGHDGEERTSHNLPLYTFLAFIGIAIDCIREGKIESGMEMLFTSGVIWGEIESKFRWQSDAGRGQKVIGGSRNSARATNERHVPMRNKRMERMGELTRDMSITSAAYQCEIEGLGGAESVRKTWNRHKDNWDS